MPLPSTASLLDALHRHRLLEPHQLAEVSATLQAGFPEPKALARELIRRSWLAW